MNEKRTQTTLGQLWDHMLKEKELPDTIDYTGNDKPLIICLTYLELIRKTKDGDICGGQVMEYLPTNNPKIYKKASYD